MLKKVPLPYFEDGSQESSSIFLLLLFAGAYTKLANHTSLNNNSIKNELFFVFFRQIFVALNEPTKPPRKFFFFSFFQKENGAEEI